MIDSGLYSAFLIAASCADREKLPQLSLAVLVMSGFKYTGVIVGALLMMIYAALKIPDWRRLFKWIRVGIVTAVAILLVNASPYITSFIHHGGPFYPSHSFVKSECFAMNKNPITLIFDHMNEDGRELGYFGRFCWAYVSQDLVKGYHRIVSGKKDFNPYFNVSGGVGGYGPVFRFFFVLSVIAAIFIRERRVLILMGVILLTVLIQPTYYSGYVRYVAQFYAFPILAMVGLYCRVKDKGRIWTRYVFCASGLTYSVPLLAYQFCFMALQWVITVQGLQIIEAGQKYGMTVSSEYMASKYALEHDCFIKVNKDTVSSAGRDSSFAVTTFYNWFTCYFNDVKPEVCGAEWSPVGNDNEARSKRDAKMMRFLLKNFIPQETMRLPLRCFQVAKLRTMQMCRSMSNLF